MDKTNLYKALELAIKPGTVYPHNNKWTYTYFLNGTKISCPDTFESASAAKAAMREFIKSGNK